MGRSRRRAIWDGGLLAGQEKTVGVWAARLLLDGGLERALATGDVVIDAALAQVLCLTDLLDAEDTSPMSVHRRLTGRLEAWGASRVGSEPAPLGEGELGSNVLMLAEAMGLSDLERRILHFVLVSKIEGAVGEVLDAMGMRTAGQIHQCVAVALGVTQADVADALIPDGALLRSGLLSFDLGWNKGADVFDLLEGLQPAVLRSWGSIDELLGQFFERAAAPTLSWRDFDHLGPEMALVGHHLRQAVRRRTPGVNVLLHGPPGTGKTELASVIARRLRVPLYSVADLDSSGGQPSARERLSAFALCQRVCGRRRAGLVLFDEAEDVFPSLLLQLFGRRGETTVKSYMNRILERNPVPAVWTANSLGGIEPSHLRRFDLVVEVPRPPARVRRRVLRRAMAGLGVSERWVRSMAAAPGLGVAHISRAAQVVAAAGTDGAEPAQELFELAVSGTLEAQGESPPKSSRGRAAALPYDLGWVAADRDLAGLAGVLAKRAPAADAGGATICLYGPPGTGKTEFARRLAQRCDRELLIRRASDLLRPFVGETEQRIARAFREAEREGAVLLIDEVDALLPDRRMAQRSWEVSQVAELLTQLERFDGVFIATTNRYEALDRAAIRRFDMKIRLDPPGPVARRRLVEAAVAAACGGRRVTLPAVVALRVDRLVGLTPGDVVATLRRRRLVGPPSDPAEFVDELAAELASRQHDSGGGGAVGFQASASQA